MKLLIEEANGVVEAESETADESSTESSLHNGEEIESSFTDMESCVSSQQEEVSANSVESSSSDSSEYEGECAAVELMQGDQPSIESAFEKFRASVKHTKQALKQ